MFLDIARRLPEYGFVWIGGDPDVPQGMLTSHYNAPGNVHLLGAVPEASRFIHLCDLFVLFSNYEGLPMTIIEAMSQRKAVVASNVGGIHELVDDSNGRLVGDEPDGAANSIKAILEDDELRSSMEKVSYDKFVDNYTLDIMWKKYKDIYSSLTK